ncbi:MAG: methyltransferase domain-containing protein [Rhizobiales bacterium]|nr:methyltransferase domain-containing protein [Hyphomicrobiales bacterium]
MTDLAEDLTRSLLIDAGISSGMRVLDIGCGRGDVTLLAAGLVGEQGRVLGIDRDPAAIEVAKGRAREAGLAHVDFALIDIDALTSDHGPFDAVVCRRVLMYQRDVVATLRKLAAVLAPGGLIAIQEHDLTAMPICRPAMPLHELVQSWMARTIAHEGATHHMGLELWQALHAAGFEVERVRAEATVLTPDQAHPIGIGRIARAMLPRIEAAGVATAEEIDVDTLDDRLLAERRDTGGSCILEMVFGAWARKKS